MTCENVCDIDYCIPLYCDIADILKYCPTLASLVDRNTLRTEGMKCEAQNLAYNIEIILCLMVTVHLHPGDYGSTLITHKTCFENNKLKNTQAIW